MSQCPYLFPARQCHLTDSETMKYNTNLKLYPSQSMIHRNNDLRHCRQDANGTDKTSDRCHDMKSQDEYPEIKSFHERDTLWRWHLKTFGMGIRNFNSEHYRPIQYR